MISPGPDVFLSILLLGLVGGAIGAGARTSWPAALQITRRASITAMFVAWALGAAAFAALAISKHLALNSHAFDLAVFDQVLWNTAQGRPFASSIMDTVTNLLGNHFSPIILALTPLGWVGDARGLLVIQALTLTGASIPIYLIARDRFGPQIALLWGAAYLIYPPTLYVNLTD